MYEGMTFLPKLARTLSRGTQAYVLAESFCCFLPYGGEPRLTPPLLLALGYTVSRTQAVGARLGGQLPEHVGDARDPGVVLQALEQHGRVPDGELRNHLAYARHGAVHHAERQRQAQLLRDDQEVADLLRARAAGAQAPCIPGAADARQLTLLLLQPAHAGIPSCDL